MSYHKFSNVCQLFNGDLMGKMMTGIDDETWASRPCNCNWSSKINGACMYEGKCKESVVVSFTCLENTDKCHSQKTPEQVPVQVAEDFNVLPQVFERMSTF